jgi:hypothetical protein
MEVYIENYNEELASIAIKCLGRMFTASIVDFTRSKYKVIINETEEIVAYGFLTYDDALQFIRHHEWTLC